MAFALQDLKDFLAKFAVHADVIAKITDEQPGGMGMASLADFRGYFTAAEYEDGVQTEILDGTFQASDRLQRSRLRVAWEKVNEVISTTAAPPAVESVHDLEQPLDPRIRNAQEAEFKAAYPDYFIEPEDFPCDPLYSRNVREF